MQTTRRWLTPVSTWLASLLASTILAAAEAMAGSNLVTPANAAWTKECGSCHVAYPPQLLPKEGWQRVMSGLERHFGADASLDPVAAAQIEAYLERYSGPEGARRSAGTVRITESAWFVHEHREVPPATWSHPAVKSAANCAACHTTAEQGDFRKRNLRVPR